MSKSDIVEKFYGVYLLKCLNPKYAGRTYIGFTVDPNRRIAQHNRGKQYGGALKTSQKGPWEMTLTVHGFPSDIAALRFEWAWQHPKKSKRLRGLIGSKKASESSFDFCLRVMFVMLSVPPWSRLPLTLRWLSAEVVIEPPSNWSPPFHMPITYGPVKSKKLKSSNRENGERMETRHSCSLCRCAIDEKSLLTCLNGECRGRWHILCLGRHFLTNEKSFGGNNSRPPLDSSKKNNLLPVEGNCPSCDCAILWGDLIRKKIGCYAALSDEKDGEQINESDSGDFLDPA